MWWDKLGVTPIRPDEAAKKKWFGAEITLKSVAHLEKTVKAAGEKGAVGWWATPWMATDKGLQATITVYFAKRQPAQAFQDHPPPAPRARAAG